MCMIPHFKLPHTAWDMYSLGTHCHTATHSVGYVLSGHTLSYCHTQRGICALWAHIVILPHTAWDMCSLGTHCHTATHSVGYVLSGHRFTHSVGYVLSGHTLSYCHTQRGICALWAHIVILPHTAWDMCSLGTHCHTGELVKCTCFCAALSRPGGNHMCKLEA